MGKLGIPGITSRLEKHSGLMVAADVPAEFIDAALAGKLEPVRVIVVHHERKAHFEWPVRPVTEEEAVMMINRYITEGRIEFGFRKKGGVLV